MWPNDLKDVTSEQWIRRSLPDEYKQTKKRRITEESTGELRNSSADAASNLPEQKAMTVDTEGYEEAFEDVNRPNVQTASEVVKIHKRSSKVVKERDILYNKIEGS